MSPHQTEQTGKGDDQTYRDKDSPQSLKPKRAHQEQKADPEPDTAEKPRMAVLNRKDLGQGCGHESRIDLPAKGAYAAKACIQAKQQDCHADQAKQDFLSE